MNKPAAAPRLSDRQRLNWLRLIRTPNVGPATFRDLIERFGTAPAEPFDAEGRLQHVVRKRQHRAEVADLRRMSLHSSTFGGHRRRDVHRRGELRLRQPERIEIRGRPALGHVRIRREMLHVLSSMES